MASESKWMKLKCNGVLGGGGRGVMKGEEGRIGERGGGEGQG